MFQYTTKTYFFVICALRVNTCEVSYIRSGLSWNARTFVRSKKIIDSLPNYIKKTHFPSLTDEIAEPRPDMNIKVAAFKVSEKSINALFASICLDWKK